MILVTGGAGFIGSNLVNILSSNQNDEIVSVDLNNKKNKNYFSSENVIKIDPSDLPNFLKKNKNKIKIIIHLGAITSTIEKNVKFRSEDNAETAKALKNQIPDSIIRSVKVVGEPDENGSILIDANKLFIFDIRVPQYAKEQKHTN